MGAILRVPSRCSRSYVHADKPYFYGNALDIIQLPIDKPATAEKASHSQNAAVAAAMW